jgi:hypothetical protein
MERKTIQIDGQAHAAVLYPRGWIAMCTGGYAPQGTQTGTGTVTCRVCAVMSEYIPSPRLPID